MDSAGTRLVCRASSGVGSAAASTPRQEGPQARGRASAGVFDGTAADERSEWNLQSCLRVGAKWQVHPVK